MYPGQPILKQKVKCKKVKKHLITREKRIISIVETVTQKKSKTGTCTFPKC